MNNPPVVGFDLDQTLVDSMAGIAATLRVALHGTGFAPDDAQVQPWAGALLQDMIAALAPGVDVEPAVLRYRAAYAEVGVPMTELLPGAAAAVDAVRAAGGRVLVVSAKAEPGVLAVLAQVGLKVDDVGGGVFGAAKGPRLARAGAAIYVGDHPGDVAAARVAGALAVSVTTGAHSEAELRAAGADVVLAGLLPFPGWFEGYCRTTDEKSRAAGH